MKNRLFFILMFIFCSYTLSAQWNTKRLLQIGKNAIYYDDYVSAIENFNNIIRLKPHLSEPFFFRGLAKMGLDDYNGAVQDFSEAIDLSPNYFHAYMYRGIAFNNLGRYKEALADYDEAIDLDPSDSYVYANKGITYVELDSLTLAERCFSRSLFLDDKQIAAYLNRAIVRERQNNIDGAMQDCNAVIKLNMFSDDAFGLRGYLWVKQKEYHNAIDDFNRALQANPDNMRILMSRAQVWYELKDYKQALMDYDTACEKDSTYIMAFYNRALLRDEIGDHNRALDDLNRVVDLNPRNILVYYNLAMIKYELKDLMGAYIDLSESISLYPDFVKAYLFRAQVNYEMNETIAAEKDKLAADAILKRYQEMKAGRKDVLVDTSANFMRLIDINSNTNNIVDIINGRIQDRKVIIELRKAFYFQYISLDSLRTGMYSNYNKWVMEFNQKNNYNLAVVLHNKPLQYSPEQKEMTIKRLDSLEQVTKDKVTYRILKSSILINSGDYMAAIALLNEVLTKEPNNLMALLNLAVARDKMYQYIESVNDTPILGKAKKKKEENARLQVDYTDVFEIYQHLQSIDPGFNYAGFNLATIYAERGDVDKAIALYTKLVSQGNELADIYYNRGLLYIYSGDLKRANIDLSKAGELGINEAYNIIKRYCKTEKY